MDIILFLGGLVLLFKKEVKISSKRTLTGKKVKILGTLLILPFVVGFLGGLMVESGPLSIEAVSRITLPLFVIAILAILYFIFFEKKNEQTD